MASNVSPKITVFFSYESTIKQKVFALKARLENEENLKIFLQENGADKHLEWAKSSNLLVCFLTRQYCETRDHIQLIEYVTRIKKNVLYVIWDKFEREQDMKEMGQYVQDSIYTICLESTSTKNDDFEAIKSSIESILKV